MDRLNPVRLELMHLHMTLCATFVSGSRRVLNVILVIENRKQQKYPPTKSKADQQMTIGITAFTWAN